MPNVRVVPVKDGLAASPKNPTLLSISVEGVSHDRKEVELNLKYKGMDDKPVFIPLPLALELSRALREAVSTYLNDDEILKELQTPTPGAE